MTGAKIFHPVADGGQTRLESATKVWDEVRSVEAELGGSGRVVLRARGTEPLIRVMVEAPAPAVADAAADRLVSVVTSELGA